MNELQLKLCDIQGRLFELSAEKKYSSAAFVKAFMTSDMSSWPMSSRQAEIITRSGAKLGDPLEKDGLVGAFCRAYYPIQEAIAEFIPTYAPCDEPNRYTYTEGTTAAGDSILSRSQTAGQTFLSSVRHLL